MTKYIVHCTETLFYEVEVEADTPGEAVEKVKDNLPDQETYVDCVFDDFEAVEKE